MILGGVSTSEYYIFNGKATGNALKYYGQNAIILSEVTTSYQQYKGLGIVGYYSTDTNYCYGKKSVDGKTYYWYSNADKITQYNDTNTTYWYMAIG